MRTLNVSSKKQLKMAIQNCQGIEEDTMIILNNKTEYLIYSPFNSLWEETFPQIIRNINKLSKDVFIPLHKNRLKGFSL